MKIPVPASFVGGLFLDVLHFFSTFSSFFLTASRLIYKISCEFLARLTKALPFHYYHYLMQPIFNRRTETRSSFYRDHQVTSEG